MPPDRRHSIEKELLRKTAFFPRLGNHGKNNRKYYAPYYSFNWGSAHFTVLNSDIGSVAADAAGKDNFWAEQKSWFEAGERRKISELQS